MTDGQTGNNRNKWIPGWTDKCRMNRGITGQTDRDNNKEWAEKGRDQQKDSMDNTQTDKQQAGLE